METARPDRTTPWSAVDEEADAAFAAYQRARDVEDLGRVFELLADDLLDVARRILGDRGLAEDVVQSAFLEVIRTADRFDCERSIRPWLKTIVRHRARDLRRSRRRQVSTVSFGLDRIDDPGPRERCELREAARAIDAALEDMPERCSWVVQLHFWSGWTARQIAAKERLPVGTVKSRLRRGLALLRGRLDQG